MIQTELSSLFSETKPKAVFIYEDEGEEFDAVCDGRKAMALFSFLNSSTAQMEEMQSVIEDARREGLVTATMELSADLPRGYASTAVLICRSEETWRIPAMKELYGVMGNYSWSLALEALMSSFLGYSSTQVAAWIAHERDERAGWNGDTVYVAMTEAQAEQVIACGSRHLPPEAIMLGPLRCFVGRGSARIGKSAFPDVPVGFAIARVLLANSYANPSVASLRATPGEGSVGFPVDASNVRLLNVSMKTTMEFLTADGWAVVKPT